MQTVNLPSLFKKKSVKKSYLFFKTRLILARFKVVSLAAVFSIVTQRSPLWVGALRDDTKNGCEGD